MFLTIYQVTVSSLLYNDKSIAVDPRDQEYYDKHFGYFEDNAVAKMIIEQQGSDAKIKTYDAIRVGEKIYLLRDAKPIPLADQKVIEEQNALEQARRVFGSLPPEQQELIRKHKDQIL